MSRDSLIFKPRLARSFYLTLRVLPGRIRHQVTLAYFMARAADTIADTDIIDRGKRREFLNRLRDALSEGHPRAVALEEIASSASAARPGGAERELLEKLPLMYRAHRQLALPDRERAARLLATLIDGMIFDLIRFPPRATGGPGALRTQPELSRYTYLVAGVVGEYWTEMLAGHFRGIARSEAERAEMKRLGVSFGQGLQMINVLRDLPRDLSRGRCYIPLDDLGRAGLAPGDLASGRARAQFIPIFREKLALTESHLHSGLLYLQKIPRRMVRNRLAVALPLLVGAATVAKLKELTDPLDPAVVAKITRPTLYQILTLAVLMGPSNRGMAWLYTRLRGEAL